LFFNKSKYEQWRNRDDIDAKTLQIIANLKGISTVNNAKRISDFIWMQNIDNLYRNPVKNGIAFIGDAAMKTNPVSGTGCAFALNSAEWLYDHTLEFLDNKKSREASLLAYSEFHKEKLAQHFDGISAITISDALTPSQKSFYDLVHSNEEISRQYLKLIYRMISPEEFQRQLLSNL
jgi:flavin-dependent dehydrogenase